MRPVLLALLLLSGCASFDAPGEYRHETVMIRWVEAANVKEQCQGAKGCAFTGLVPCLVITEPKPDVRLLGHEVKHCFVGEFHK